MRKHTWLKSTAIAFLVITIALPFLWQDSYTKADLFAPTWLKTGTYAQYITGPNGLLLMNGSFPQVDHNSTKNSDIIFRWECLEQTGTTAKLNISIDWGPSEGGFHRTNVVYVDTVNRTVTLLNGTQIGTTRLWLPANPSQGQEITFWETSAEKVLGTVNAGANGETLFFNTVQGVQKGFYIDANGTIMGQQYFTPAACYDFDSGVALTNFLLFEPTVVALDIKEIIGGSELAMTNIDLGPREISFDIRAALPYAALISAIIIITVALVVRRRRKLKSEALKIL
jgi:hypothetical protein